MSDSEPVPEVADETAISEPLPEVAGETAGGEPIPGAADDTTGHDIKFLVMTVESVTFDLSESAPRAHLMEAEMPFRNLSIPIALPEAHALYNAMFGIEGRRPSTHELTSAILRQLQADVIAARILRHEEGVYYAELDVMTPRGRERFDCRTSDALILALRQQVPAPVLCAEEVLDNLYS